MRKLWFPAVVVVLLTGLVPAASADEVIPVPVSCAGGANQDPPYPWTMQTAAGDVHLVGAGGEGWATCRGLSFWLKVHAQIIREPAIAGTPGYDECSSCDWATAYSGYDGYHDEMEVCFHTHATMKAYANQVTHSVSDRKCA